MEQDDMLKAKNLLLEFESGRAKHNLQESVKYRTVLEWVKEALKQGIYSNEQIIKEIDEFLLK